MTRRPIRVLQLISSLEMGGAEKLLLDLLDYPDTFCPVDFTLVVMNAAVNPQLKDRLEKLKVNTYYLNRPQGHWHPRYLFSLFHIISRHAIEVIHSHNSGSKWWSILCKLINPSLKLVFTVHDTAPMRLSAFQKWIQRVWIDHYIAVSQSVERLCLYEGLRPVTRIYNGIPLSTYRNPHRLSLKKRIQIANFQEVPLRIVQIGRLYYPKKGQDLMLQALAQCRKAGLSINLTLMGGVYDYSEQSYRHLQQLVKTLNLQDCVNFLVNQSHVPEVLRQVDLFVLPSRYEGLGLVVLEAMAAGVPVIASNVDGPAELIRHGQNGLLFESGNVRSLVQGIQQLYESPDVADRLAQNALAFVRRFDIQSMQAQYHQFYQNILYQESVDLKPVSYPLEVIHGSAV